jgi:hypothetical protein
MSHKTVAFKRKLAQQFRKSNSVDKEALLPRQTVKSQGLKMVYGQADAMDEFGKPQREGRRYPGIASGRVCSEPISERKAAILMAVK